MRNIAFASCAELPVDDEDCNFILEECARRGVNAVVIPWTEMVDFALFDAVILKSCWDYSDHGDDFLNWAKTVSSVTKLLNPYQAVEWNQHKRYLLELQNAGLEIVPTILVEHGIPLSWDSLVALDAWSDAIIKPAVSAGSAGFTRVLPEGRRREIDVRSAVEDILVQPFLSLTESLGERAIVVLAGEPSHVLLRKWSSPTQLSVSVEPVSEEDRIIARKVSRFLPWFLPYLRIDLLPYDGDSWLISEVEAIEPKLYLERSSGAVSKYIDAILE